MRFLFLSLLAPMIINAATIFSPAPILDSIPMHVVSNYSVHYAGWAVLQGDTLFCREHIGTDNPISLISLADSLHPTFLGFSNSEIFHRYNSTLVYTANWNDTPSCFADEPILDCRRALENVPLMGT
jgi:hypothetical protein